MTFADLRAKYPNREAAFPSNLPKPTATELNRLIEKYHCQFPQSFIEFQLEQCIEIPMGDNAFDGFGFANTELPLNMSLEEVLKDYESLEYPDHLIPFKQDNGDFWCFDTTSLAPEFSVVIFDHNSMAIEKDANYRWKNFIDWLDKTMLEE
ncbi:MAG: SMI1/KNR4 family protein [Schleiferiaceae bacterium]|jgi:hypothetical protein|nr:SMI1/KNR4 family protein [Schleiferiaceae bacterium]